ncbi:MAG TPA: hydroxyethylthiazole kinase [Candidatus Eisenbergiella intestinipullorum]|nr:hydroxyethylthiazole kinase [Candidatus Eisenbergiella intestinipullorum]
MRKECLENVRRTAPLIHCITNYVTINDVANVLLACGARPIMSDEAEDAAQVTSICAGLDLNLGQLHRTGVEGMLRAGRKANELGHPVLLDPVGVGVSDFRREAAGKLMEEISFTAIRGNASEIRALAEGRRTSGGVDAEEEDAVTGSGLERDAAFVKAFAAQTGCIIAMTGRLDLVADQDRCYVIRNGRPEMSRVTGTGCQLSGLMCAYLAANPTRPLEAAASAVCAMGLAGELAWSRMREDEGNASYRTRIIDAVCLMSGEELEQSGRMELL